MSLKTAKLKSAGGGIATLGLAVVILGLAYLVLTPKTYQATARIKLTHWVHVRDLNDPTDLSAIPAECDHLRSKPLLLQVVHNLHLEDRVPRTNSSASRVSDDEAVEWLRSKTIVVPMPSSSIIEIGVSGSTPDEVDIANEIARVYLAERGSQRTALVQAKLAEIKKQWDEQNQKIDTAQSQLDDLYFHIRHNRATNQIQFYDAEAFQTLKNDRADLETNWEAQRDLLDQLKQKSPDDLKQFFSSHDDNARLAGLLIQVNAAKSHLASARSDHGEDSSEVKQAAFTLGQLQKRADGTVQAMLRLKQVDVDALKAALDATAQKIENGRTNAVASTPQEIEYERARLDLDKLKSDRADLQKKIDVEESQEAIAPATTIAQLIDSAEVPKRAKIPDQRIAAIIMGGGGVVILCGLAMVFVGSRQPKKTATAA